MRVVLVTLAIAASSTAEAAPGTCIDEITINGLWICGEPTETPSHGGEEFVKTAHYKLENRGTKPITLELIKLEVLDPKDKPMLFAIDYADFLPKPRQEGDDRSRTDGRQTSYDHERRSGRRWWKRRIPSDLLAGGNRAVAHS